MADVPRPFVHLDVQSAYSVGGTSPSLPEDYVQAVLQQYPLDANHPDPPRPISCWAMLAFPGLLSVSRAARPSMLSPAAARTPTSSAVLDC
jgi:hypothetical protein